MKSHSDRPGLSDVQSELYASRLDAVCGAALSLAQQCEWLSSRLRCRVILQRVERESGNGTAVMEPFYTDTFVSEIESLGLQAESITHSLAVIGAEAKPKPEPAPQPELVWKSKEVSHGT